MCAEDVQLQCFFVSCIYDTDGIAYVCPTAEDAMAMALADIFFSGYGRGYLDIRVNTGADISGLPPGEVEASIDALKRNIYAIIDGKCDLCAKMGRVSIAEDQTGAALCLECVGLADVLRDGETRKEGEEK